MKCKYCGGNISLEASYCPYCGKPNEHAVKHERDMQTYHRVYEDTRSDVQEAAHKYTGTTVRMAVIAFLVIINILLLVLASKGYDIKRAWVQNQMENNAKEVKMQLDQYLEEEDYLSFVSFCDENYIRTYDSEFEDYVVEERAGRNYAYVYYAVMRVANPPSYADQEDQVEMLSETLDSYYRSVDIDEYEYYENFDKRKAQELFERMNKKVEVLLCTYCRLSEEEAKNLQEMSGAKRAVTLEEALFDE